MRSNTLFRSFVLVGTILTILCLCATFRTSDAEGRLFAAGFCGIGTCFFAPQFAVVFGYHKLRFAAFLAIVATIAVLYLNAWASKESETQYTSPLDHLYLLIFSLAGLVVAIIAAVTDRRKY